MESEAIFSAVFENAPVVMILLDEDRRIKKANRAATESLGRTTDGITGLSGGEAFRCLNALDDPKGCGFGPRCMECMIRNTVLDTFQTGKNRYQVEATIPVAKDDEQIDLDLLVSTTVLPLSGEKLVLVCLEDVTEFKKAEVSLIQLNETLKLMNMILRHDIRNDFAVIYSALELIKTNIEKNIDPKSRGMFDKAFKAIDRSNLLIEKIGKLAPLVTSGGDLKSFDLRKVVEEVSNKYSLKFEIEGDCNVLADEALDSVIDNIINNAIVHGKTDKIDIRIEQKEDACEFRIADYGVGIPDEIKQRIFDEGFKHDKGGYSGLGLYIVKKAVDRYGGRLLVEDNIPSGAVFILNLRSARKRPR